MGTGSFGRTGEVSAATSGTLIPLQPVRKRLTLLVALIEPHAANRCIAVLRAAGFEVFADAVHSPEKFRQAIQSKKYDLIIGEQETGCLAGGDSVSSDVDIPVILITGKLSSGEVDELLRLGVADCLAPGEFARLPLIAMRLLQMKRLQEEAAWANRVRRLAEERYRSLFEQNLVGVYRASLEGRILDLNETCAWLFGYASCDGARTHMLHEVASSERDVEYLLRRVQEKKTITNFELELRQFDGQPRWTLASASLFDHERESSPFVEGTLVDITRWKRAEDAARRGEHRFRALLEKSLDAISLLDSTGNVLYSSHAVSPIFGYDLEERIGKSVFEHVHPEDVPRVLSHFGKMVERPFSSTSVQLRYRHKDGSWRWIEALGTNLLEDPSVQAVVVNYRDVTEQRRLQDQLFQAQKMETVRCLAGGVAHDFNNLLTAILGYSDMVLEGAPRQGALYRYGAQIKQAGERAGALTRQLLAFSRLQVMAAQILDLNAVISEMSRMLRRVIGEDIKLEFIPGAALGRVKVDPAQLEQVILNLAVNARDAMPQGGTLTIRTANEVLGETLAEDKTMVESGPYVLVEIADTGCGMDSETRARAFEPFFTTKERGKGTGLGLSTVYGIVKQSGGYIWISTEVGKGTAFKIYLPSVDEDVSIAKPAEAPSAGAGGAETILLVEDDNAVRGLLWRVLRSKGYRMLEAKRGDDALGICESHKDTIHLILTDVVMPKMSGQELARRALMLHPEAKLLYMTGYAGNKIGSAELLELGAQFIQKPFSAEALSQKIRSLLDPPEKTN